ncbi:MAG: anthranilate synthase component I family protein [Thermoguttaceae bacterium]
MMNFEQFQKQALNATVVPVTIELFADIHTPVTLLERFYHGQEGIFLLESVEGGEKWGRYSFIGIEAHAFIEVYTNHISIRYCDDNGTPKTEKQIPHYGKPLECLREILNSYNALEQPALPRFFGGLVGYFAYEMVSFFEPIPHKLENEPFAAFVIPSSLLIIDNAKQLLTVCVSTFPNPQEPEKHKSIYEKAHHKIKQIIDKLELPLAFSSPKYETQIELHPVLTENEYRKHVESIKEHIRCGNIIQCVFSQPFESEKAPEAVSLYRCLRLANPAPYLFFMHLAETVLVGSSPETMIRLEGRTATVRPIAGTRKRGKTEQRDRELADEMLSDPKEKAEHLMLVDLGRNDLGRVAKTGSVQVTDLMFIERHTHVMHLVSSVTAELDNGYDGFDLFRATFPAGTLSGAPKVKAMQIIADEESSPRGPYGGAVGYISYSGNIDFAITIRTAQIKDGKLHARAGGGIVFDSQTELERQETVNKAMGVTRALEILYRSRYGH